MKIGIIAHDAFPLAQPYAGGLEMITHLLSNELSKRGHSVTTLCRRGSQVLGDIIEYENFPSNDAGLNFDYNKAIDYFIKTNFDIVHNHSLGSKGVTASEEVRYPYIVSFHTPMFKDLIEGINNLAFPQKLLCTGVSDSLCDEYRAHVNAIRTVYNGIDLDEWSPHYLKQGFLSWAGRICKEKGLYEVLKYCYLNNLRIKFAGPVYAQDYFDEFISQFIHEGSCCEYVGHINRKELNSMIKNSKSFVFSSTWNEPYGLVIAESLACGTPIMYTQVGASEEIITKRVGSPFQLDDEQSFINAYNAIDNLDPRHCRERAEEFCSHQKMIDAYEVLYNSLVSFRIAV